VGKLENAKIMSLGCITSLGYMFGIAKAALFGKPAFSSRRDDFFLTNNFHLHCARDFSTPRLLHKRPGIFPVFSFSDMENGESVENGEYQWTSDKEQSGADPIISQPRKVKCTYTLTKAHL
jgi:hypothetical protein